MVHRTNFTVRMLTIAMASAIGVVPSASPGASDGQLSISFQTAEVGGRYAPKNCVAVWVETAGGAFVRTVGRWAATHARDLGAWRAASGMDTDAVSGATRRSHSGRLEVVWDLVDRDGNAVPDGAYEVHFELADGANDHQSFAFDKTPASSQRTDGRGVFSDIDFDYVAATSSAPGVLRLSAAALTVREGDKTVQVRVVRDGGDGGDDGPVSVRYATTDASAVQGLDYVHRSGLLELGDGQTEASIDISIADDDASETDETFTLSLSEAAGGAGLGAPTTVTITIQDDDSPPAPPGGGGDAGPEPEDATSVGCGDGRVGGQEQCDGPDLGGLRECADLGLGAGLLSCSSTCEWEVADCAHALPASALGGCVAATASGSSAVWMWVWLAALARRVGRRWRPAAPTVGDRA